MKCHHVLLFNMTETSLEGSVSFSHLSEMSGRDVICLALLP